jgi:hypothetical protein
MMVFISTPNFSCLETSHLSKKYFLILVSTGSLFPCKRETFPILTRNVSHDDKAFGTIVYHATDTQLYNVQYMSKATSFSWNKLAVIPVH